MPIISKILKISIVSIFVLFATLSLTQADEVERSSYDKIRFTISSIYDGLSNFSYYSEDFLNTSFDVYKGNVYINNYCNTQDRFYAIDERQDLYNLLVKNGFGYTTDQIAVVNNQLNVVSLEIEFLKNLDVYQPYPYGEFENEDGNVVNIFDDKGNPLMFDRLKESFTKAYGLDPTIQSNKERLEGLIKIFADKYSYRFNYYDSTGTVLQGDYASDECLGGFAAIKNKFNSVIAGYKNLGNLGQDTFGKESNKLMRKIKEFWTKTKSVADFDNITKQLQETYNLDENREYSFLDGLTNVLKKHFPTAEKQLKQFNDTYVDKTNQNKNLGNKTQAKVEQIVMESSSVKQFNQYLNQTSTFEEYAFLQSAIQEVSRQQTQKQFENLLLNQEAQISDFMALELASVLDITNQTLISTNDLIKERQEDSLHYNLKMVHEKQCKDE